MNLDSLVSQIDFTKYPELFENKQIMDIVLKQMSKEMADVVWDSVAEIKPKKSLLEDMLTSMKVS